MAYEVQTAGVRGPVRPAAAPDPARAGRPLRGVARRPSSTPTWSSSSACEGLDLDVATEFLLIAATLVELKTRRLLPGDDDIDLDDELALWEERDLLLARLLECKTFKDAAGAAGRAGRRRRSLAPPPRRASTSASSTSPPTCSKASPPSDLRDAFLRASAPKPVPTRRPAPRRPDPAQRHRRRRRAGRRAAPGRAHRLPRRSPRRSSSGSRSSCASSPSSSCSSRAWSTSSRPTTFGDIDGRLARR